MKCKFRRYFAFIDKFYREFNFFYLNAAILSENLLVVLILHVINVPCGLQKIQKSDKSENRLISPKMNHIQVRSHF